VSMQVGPARCMQAAVAVWCELAALIILRAAAVRDGRYMRGERCIVQAYTCVHGVAWVAWIPVHAAWAAWIPVHGVAWAAWIHRMSAWKPAPVMWAHG